LGLESLGRAVYRRRYIVLVVWAAIFIAALPFAPRAADFLKPGGFTREHHQAVQARRVLQERLGFSTVSLEVVFQHPQWTAYQPEFTQAVLRATASVAGAEGVSSVRTHLDDPARVGKSGHSVHVTIGLQMQLEEAIDALEGLTARIDPGPLQMTVTGGPTLYKDISLASEADLRRSETFAFPLAAFTLLLVFGALAAAVAPAVVGGTGVAVALAVIFFLSQGVDMSVFALNIVSLLGIGLGIDYSLFYTSRFREELANGRSVPDAIAATQRAAGTAIVFSAIASLVGLASLLAFDSMVLQSVGIGAIAVIGAALLASTTLMPALLSVLGERVNRYRIGIRWDKTGKSLWAPLSLWVMKRPILVLVPTVTFLVALAIPVKDLRLGTVDATVLPPSMESRQGFDLLREEFGFTLNTFIPVAYTFEGSPFEQGNLAAVYAYGRALEGLPEVKRVTSIVTLDKSYTFDQYKLMYARPEALTDINAQLLLQDTVRDGIVVFGVQSESHPFSPEARRLVGEIRALRPPSGHRTYVDGGSGEVKDIVDSLYGRFPLAIGAVVAVTYVTLLLLFRSLLLPLKAVVLNVLSILASYGALVFVFQQGHLSGLLDFQSLGMIEATTPILLFAILFGLSMDYEIFLLSRVAEAYKRTGDNRASVAEGLEKSGLIITGAGAILVVVAASFLAADIVIVKAVGLGLALAVFVDVTIVRALVAPALMRIAGKWNWWLPGWLARILLEVHGVA